MNTGNQNEVKYVEIGTPEVIKPAKKTKSSKQRPEQVESEAVDVRSTEPVKPEQTTKQTDKSIEQLADEVERGVHGSGRERMISLGVKYAAVQKEVTRRIRAKQ